MPSRFPNQGLWEAERLFENAHPRAAQYLDQAPILVMWALPWALSGEQAAEPFVRLVIAGHCEKGVALKEFLRSSGFTAPMRGISAKTLLPSRMAVYRLLARIDPIVLGRVLPATIKGQKAWITALYDWVSKWKRKAFLTARFEEYLIWCVVHFANAKISTGVAEDLADFQALNNFNTAWSLKRAQEEMHNWHLRITLDSQIKLLPVGPDQPIDLGDHPAHADFGTLRFTALRTPRQIADEGAAMRHCVATYIRGVFDGQSHIISITEADKRVATLELDGPKRAQRWSVRQLRGPRNSPVSATVKSAAELYAGLLQHPRAGSR